MTTGGCLCGGVRYQIAESVLHIIYCHCEQCRRAQGSAFAASAPVPAAAFTVVAGQEVLRAYRSSSAKTRYFCSECGSPLYSHVDGHSQVRVRAGSLDPPAEPKAIAHIFVADKAPWYDIKDDLPQFAGREPDRI